jgi:purine-binding chemotaxis protein CheW
MNDFTQKNSADFDSYELNLIPHDVFFDEQSEQTKRDKYVVFCLGADFFAVSTDKVSEVVQMLAITPLPNVPEWLLGIADLRGTMISVVNLQKLLGISVTAVSPRTKFVVLKSPNFPSTVALAVDRLSEIIFLPRDEIQFIKDGKTPLVLGRATYTFNTLTLLNVENLLSSLTIQ